MPYCTARKLYPQFRGVSVQTHEDLHAILNKGFTGDWVGNPHRIEESGQLMVMSMTDRGKYFIATIKKVKTAKAGKDHLPEKRTRYIIYFDHPGSISGTINPDLKFFRTPVQYHTKPARN